VAGHSNEESEQTEALTKNQKETSHSTSKLQCSIVENYEMVQGAQLSDSVILLMVLSEAKSFLYQPEVILPNICPSIHNFFFPSPSASSRLFGLWCVSRSFGLYRNRQGNSYGYGYYHS